MVRDFYLEAALVRKRTELEHELANVGFEPWAPIRRQLLALVRDVNYKRKLAGLDQVRKSCLRFQRKQVRPFEPVDVRDDKGEAA